MKYKYCMFVGALILCIASTACARQGVIAAHSVSSGPHSHSVYSRFYLAGECGFTLNLDGGSLSVDSQSHVKGAVYSAPGTEEWSFSVKCYAGASQSDIYNRIGAKPLNGEWFDLNFERPFVPKQKFKFIKFSGRNWKGMGTAIDEIYYADADRRSRNFSFCLVENNGPQVLCGFTPIRGVTQPDSASTLPKILAVLKTLVFVDPPTYTLPPEGTAKATLALGKVHTEGACRFRLDEAPYQKYKQGAYWFLADQATPEGTTSRDKSFLPKPWFIGMACHAGMTQADTNQFLHRKRVDGQWKDTYSNRFFDKISAKAYTFHGSGWTGQAAAYSDGARRKLLFCLKQHAGSQALCGSALLGDSRSKALPTRRATVMDVLKSIVFIDKVSHASVPSGSMASP